jgi:hypothetical protein
MLVGIRIVCTLDTTGIMQERKGMFEATNASAVNYDAHIVACTYVRRSLSVLPKVGGNVQHSYCGSSTSSSSKYRLVGAVV